MLILLSDEFQGRLAELIEEPQFRRAMGNLLLGHRDGKHIVSAPGAVLNELIRLSNGDDQGVWRKIRRERPNLGTLREHVTHLCIVEPENDKVVQRKQNGEQTCFHVPYTHFDDFERIGGARLVAEDQDDAVLFELAARAYVSFSSDLRGSKVVVHTFGGGGGNTADTFREHARHAFTIGIADSDRKWPGAALGDTAKALKVALVNLEKQGRSVVDLLILPCHEIENLLPAALVRDALTEATFRQRCLAAERLGVLGAEAPLHHLDIKHGLTLRDVFDARNETQKHEFLDGVARRHLNGRNACYGEPDCSDRNHCRCRVLDGLGDKLVVRAAECCSKISAHKCAQYFFNNLVPCRSTWLDLCRRIFSFGCAYPRSRV